MTPNSRKPRAVYRRTKIFRVLTSAAAPTDTERCSGRRHLPAGMSPLLALTEQAAAGSKLVFTYSNIFLTRMIFRPLKLNLTAALGRRYVWLWFAIKHEGCPEGRTLEC